MQGVINVQVAFDPEARVWYVVESSVPGVRVEAETLEDMFKRVEAALIDLLEDDGDGSCEVPVEVVARHNSRLRLEAA